ncbi:protein adenylyltransferase SelO [Pseudophaeobacter arcticus]|uniref:protein adenylyltransferase SelO n=1 Tax=Pseudophaeobacter arcticus TaxID=385492 RepID=UPI003A9719FC
MALHIPFDNTYAQLGSGFYSRQRPAPVAAPQLIAFNQTLADLLQVQAGDLVEMAEVFAGNQVPEGADPLAQAYAGHQFGTFNPQLGDGRAILLGEVLGTDGRRYDLQLKGAGRTPYSRQGDGRAWLGPVLREYVVSEAMFALGVPTTRALAAVSTGETVWREGGMPGAVLTRVAASHLRVGTFQFFAARGQTAALRQLTEYAISRHYPQAEGPMGLLRAVRDAQVRLIAAWMSVGFIHGVMNTDNSSISGETIDYGPCAFMDHYRADQVFSSIDRMGRYAYSNQPSIAVWNLAQLATALIQQLDDPQQAVEEATEIVHTMPALIETEWLRLFRRKIGLETAQDADMDLISDLLELMEQGQADFTNSFRALADGRAVDYFRDSKGFEPWQARWMQRCEQEQDPQAIMRASNPVYIPRNHRIEEMIASAVAGDFTLFERLGTVLQQPFTEQQGAEDLQRPPEAHEVVTATFCGT